jgi:hypothetical protein
VVLDNESFAAELLAVDLEHHRVLTGRRRSVDEPGILVLVIAETSDPKASTPTTPLARLLELLPLRLRPLAP